MNPLIHLKIVGALQILLGLAHVTFPKRFHWKEELARLSLLNRQIFLVHCFFIVLILMMLGVFSLFATEALLQPSRLSRIVLSGITLFWICRLFVQLFVYDVSLWRGNRLHMAIHILFVCMWLYFVMTYAAALREVWQ